MAVYTVHEPPAKLNELGTNPDQFVFVREGFSFWAFLLGPLWMLRHRMWLVLLGYAIVIAAIEGGQYLLGAPQLVRFAVSTLLALLIGFEGATLRRFTLGRRRWTNLGVIIGDDLESAERRFFDAWVRREGGSPGLPAAAAPPPSAPDVIGLFPQPQPGARR
jgi:hypothetical protein